MQSSMCCLSSPGSCSPSLPCSCCCLAHPCPYIQVTYIMITCIPRLLPASILLLLPLEPLLLGPLPLHPPLPHPLHHHLDSHSRKVDAKFPDRSFMNADSGVVLAADSCPGKLPKARQTPDTLHPKLHPDTLHTAWSRPYMQAVMFIKNSAF